MTTINSSALAVLSAEDLRRKADQSWELAGLARQDRDGKDEHRCTAEARAYEAELSRRRVDAMLAISREHSRPVARHEIERAAQISPIDMVLHCPACGDQHVDEPDDESVMLEKLAGNGKPWTNPPHRSHLCSGCGHVWRPADVPTNGVRTVQTRGEKDDPVLERSPTRPPHLAVEEMRAAKDAAYLERNRLVALLATIYPSGVAKTAIEGWTPEWHNCVYIDLPTGQASWHYHDQHAYLFAHLPVYRGEWDGHTTEEKYLRVLSECARLHVLRIEKEEGTL